MTPRPPAMSRSAQRTGHGFQMSKIRNSRRAKTQASGLRGAASDQFLRHAGDLVGARGGAVAAVDVTIICERPKVGPHRVAMVERIAEILSIAAERVSVKATTTDRLGFTGRGEGIAAQAVATVRLPL